MVNLAKSLPIVGVLTLGIIVPTETAQAYVDPSTGSYVSQLVLAGLLGGLFAVKNIWRDLKSRIESARPRHDESPTPKRH